jgi:hypothetical protein
VRHFRVPNGIASAPFAVVLDANVLYPFVLRDTLLRAAQRRFYAPNWSEQILEEATRNLVADGRMTLNNARRLQEQLHLVMPEAFIADYQHLINAMPNEPKDRHAAKQERLFRRQQRLVLFDRCCDKSIKHNLVLFVGGIDKSKDLSSHTRVPKAFDMIGDAKVRTSWVVLCINGEKLPDVVGHFNQSAGVH